MVKIICQLVHQNGFVIVLGFLDIPQDQTRKEMSFEKVRIIVGSVVFRFGSAQFLNFYSFHRTGRIESPRSPLRIPLSASRF